MINSSNGTKIRPGAAARRHSVPAAAALALSFGLLLSEPARAQISPQLATTPVERSDRYVYRNVRPYWINYEDCVADDEFTFAFTLETILPLEVWVGSDDCPSRRGSNDRGQCWLVASVANPTRTLDVVVPARNVVARNLGALQVPENVSAAVCDEPSVTAPAGESLTYYFMLIENGKSVAHTTWDGGAEKTGYDVVGPTPPASISVGVGENQLAISVSGVDEAVDRERFEAFCVPAGTPGNPASDAGGAGASATDGGTAPDPATGQEAPAACATPLMRAGARPPLAFSCGTADETSRTLRTTALDNGTTYAVGVAGQDILGNAGVLSDVACGTPAVLDDFFEVYSRSGGPGGGGFCSVTAPGTSERRHAVPWIAGVGLAWMLRARARRSRAAKRTQSERSAR